MKLALVGMPGCGKSTIGRHLGRRFDVPFVDSDAEIEKRLDCSIGFYFQRHGEAAFRDVEVQVIDELTRASAFVLATGGGAVLREENRRALADRCTVVYLKASPEDLWRRLKHDTKRPLLQGGDGLGKLRDLHAERDPYYTSIADFCIETGPPSQQTMVNMIAMQVELAGLASAPRTGKTTM
ncbi:shikimate kinase [Aquabacterium sp. A7-Y]|uniref:shikimate kinase n=1 Tax=Aquabacterium sp. A7-Y TaxID=1349605 RepID=UPI00223E867B|nr:shikimate kinase [Aquabacterium sp. A7-Y]MCW7539057.1 shikimate kinase [Aquabacterium sp. A7-Y]